MAVFGRFIAQVALGIYAAQLLSVASCEAADGAEESCDGLPAKGHQFIQTARKTRGSPKEAGEGGGLVLPKWADSGHSRTLAAGKGPDAAEKKATEVESLTSTTTFCYQNSSTNGCWSQKPDMTTPNCSSSSGSTACRCLDVDCHVDELASGVPATGRCISTLVYVVGGHREVNEHGEVNIVGISKEVYCTQMLRIAGWKERHLVALPDDKPAENGMWWIACWSPNSWHNWQCHRKKRYLGEMCWDGYFEAGKCSGSEHSVGEFAVTCHKGTCVPAHWALEETKCKCAWMGFSSLLGCSAAGNKCDGHPCVQSSGQQNFLCDYSSGVNW